MSEYLISRLYKDISIKLATAHLAGTGCMQQRPCNECILIRLAFSELTSAHLMTRVPESGSEDGCGVSCA
jgi:hypothetical protein